MLKYFEINNVIYSANEFGEIFGSIGKLKQRLNADGYPTLTLGSKYIKRGSFRVHRIIAKLFVENSENKPEVNHIDGNKSNNYFNNLEWVTRSEQMLHAHKLGLKSCEGEKNANHKLTEENVKEIRNLIDTGESIASIARLYGRGWQTINHIAKRSTWINVH